MKPFILSMIISYIGLFIFTLCYMFNISMFFIFLLGIGYFLFVLALRKESCGCKKCIKSKIKLWKTTEK